MLHGHDHRDFFKQLPGRDGRPIPVVGIGSASYQGSPGRRSRYNIVEIDGKSITVVTYAHDRSKSKYVEFARRSLG